MERAALRAIVTQTEFSQALANIPLKQEHKVDCRDEYYQILASQKETQFYTEENEAYNAEMWREYKSFTLQISAKVTISLKIWSVAKPLKINKKEILQAIQVKKNKFRFSFIAQPVSSLIPGAQLKPQALSQKDKVREEP